MGFSLAFSVPFSGEPKGPVVIVPPPPSFPRRSKFLTGLRFSNVRDSRTLPLGANGVISSRVNAPVQTIQHPTDTSKLFASGVIRRRFLKTSNIVMPASITGVNTRFHDIWGNPLLVGKK